MEPVREYSEDELIALLPLPADNANKYTRGMLAAVVGSVRYPGAACLAASAGQRTGAGYTEVLTDPNVVGIVQAWRPSLVVRPWSERASIDAPATTGKPRACIVGSGFDADDAASGDLVHFVLKHARMPVLVDGGGLGALASKKGQRLLKRRFLNGWDTVVTPHGGEAARLAHAFALPTDDPATLSRLLALAFGVTAVVKGPDTYFSDGETVARMAHGTAALAKAGTGDVLAGMIGALLAQGIATLDAVALGTDLHARAGRIAASQLSAIAATAEDVVERIPAAIAELASA
ncbi:MAG: NAD(P)H-hydrate dehydratase [Gordonibacter sp.]|uniref:NAD(P)H-hydrate dehydratase n=1 Tax=Gordonibacter sp. TaxID=1968902 RepID=UPI002FCB6F59